MERFCFLRSSSESDSSKSFSSVEFCFSSGGGVGFSVFKGFISVSFSGRTKTGECGTVGDVMAALLIKDEDCPEEEEVDDV